MLYLGKRTLGGCPVLTRGQADVTWAYAAGRVGGEGGIGLSKSSANPQHRRNPRYEPEVTVVNTSLPMLTWLQDEFGGALKARKKQKPHPKQAWAWKLGNHQAASFCNGVLPFLRVKREQALLIIEYMATARPPEHRGQGAELSTVEVAKREAIDRRGRAWKDRR